MAILGRNGILDAQDLETREVAVPEWGGEVLVRALTGEERDAFESSQVELNKNGSPKANMENIRARLVVLCVINEDGERIFNRADIKLLGRKSAKALERVVNVCNELNGFSEEDVEALAEGFDGAPSEGATSD
jgi:hypothetical protein